MSDRQVVVLHAVTDSISTVLLRGQMKYLRSLGYEPGLLCSPGIALDRIGYEEKVAVFGVAMQREVSPARDVSSLLQIWWLLRRVRPLICNSGTPKAGLLVGVAAWLARSPCRIYTLRGLRLETKSGFTRSLLMLTEKIACSCAHRVICVSPSLRERAIELGLVSKYKAVVLGAGSSHGVDSDRFARTPDKVRSAAQLRQQLGIRPDQPVIGFAGRFTRDKGLPELVAAFQAVRTALPSAILLLVGSHESGDAIPSETRQLIEADKAVICVEFTANIELYYLIMHVFALPTHREGFPNTILEAHAAGLPVVTTTATGAVDAVLDGVNGLLVPVGDSMKLAESLLSVLADPARAREFGQAGRERVLREFRDETVWAALASLYREMLEERGLPIPSSDSVAAA